MTEDRRELVETSAENLEEPKKIDGQSDAELEEISGGDWSQWINSDMSYSSGDTPKYSVGQKVKVCISMRNHSEGEIVSVGGKTGGIKNKEFVYSVRVYGDQFQRQFHPDGYIENGIYESNISPL